MGARVGERFAGGAPRGRRAGRTEVGVKLLTQGVGGGQWGRQGQCRPDCQSGFSPRGLPTTRPRHHTSCQEPAALARSARTQPKRRFPVASANQACAHRVRHPQITLGTPQQRWCRPPDARCCLTPLFLCDFLSLRSRWRSLARGQAGARCDGGWRRRTAWADGHVRVASDDARHEVGRVDWCLEHLLVVLLPLASSCDCSWRILAAKSPSVDRQWLTPLVSVDPPPSKYPGAV